MEWLAHFQKFQKSGECLFCCGNFIQEDSIEHYSCCRTTHLFGRKLCNLRAQEGGDRLGELVTLGLNSGTSTDDDIVLKGIWNYALYRAVCTINHSPMDNQEEVVELMKQLAREGVRENEDAQKVLRGVWAQHSNTQSNHNWLLEGAQDLA